MGGLKKAFKSVTGLVSKGVGAITGTNAAAKAASQQSKQMKAQAEQERQTALRSMQDQATQAAQANTLKESSAARDAAIEAAKDTQRQAQEGNSEAVDVTAGGGSSELIKRESTRSSFFGGSGGSGLRL